MRRLRIGFYNLTGCVGCMLSVLFNEREIMELSKLVDLRARKEAIETKLKALRAAVGGEE